MIIPSPVPTHISPSKSFVIQLTLLVLRALLEDLICLNLSSPLHELRDIDVNGQRVIAMQSNDKSQLSYILNGKPMRMSIDTNEVFYDGMAMYAMKGMLFGDPVDSKFPIYYTNSGGIKWVHTKTTLNALEGEFGFSANAN